MRTPLILVTALALLAPAVPAADTGPAAGAPLPTDVPAFTPPAPGEHPRLLFRKTDLPALRQRAQTPEGQAILKRLRQLLDGGNGDTFPKIFNASAKASAGNRPAAEDDAAASKPGDDPSLKNAGKNAEMPVGAYTIGHAAGYGLLYQLTGEQKYADLGRQAVEKALDGVRDRDDRYAWRTPGGALRAGPALGAYALGYDLCYDGWDPAFREKVARAFADYDEGPHMSLESLALGKRHGPGSNHWGPQIGGAALALLAIKGDPGAADSAAKLDKLLKGNADCFVRHVTVGFGDRGFFPEGDGPGTIASDTAFVTALRAWRVAGGKDFLPAARDNAAWLTMKWVMLTVPTPVDVGKKPLFPTRGGYPHNVWARNGMSGSGTFAQGFGAVTDAQKPALLWLYNHTFRAGDDKAGAPFDTTSPYPHRAVQAFVNWPLGLDEQNPAAVLPKAAHDKQWSFVMFRNRWQDENDVVVTALLKNAKGNGTTPGGEIIVLAHSKRDAFPVKVTGAVTHFAATATGGTFSTSAGAFAADFSGASGADALLVLAGPTTGGKSKKPNVTTLQAGKNTFTIMTLTKGPLPGFKPDGDTVKAGAQTISYADGKLTFAK
jgi:hypothetical protein